MRPSIAFLALFALLNVTVAFPLPLHSPHGKWLLEYENTSIPVIQRSDDGKDYPIWTWGGLRNWFGGTYDWSYGKDPADNGYVVNIPAGATQEHERAVSIHPHLPSEAAPDDLTSFDKRDVKRDDHGPGTVVPPVYYGTGSNEGYQWLPHDYYHYAPQKLADTVINAGENAALLNLRPEWLAMYKEYSSARAGSVLEDPHKIYFKNYPP